VRCTNPSGFSNSSTVEAKRCSIFTIRWFRGGDSKPFQTVASVIGGLLLTLAFPPFSIFPCAWFAFVPIINVSPDGGPTRAFRLGFYFGLAHAISSLYWITYVLHRYGYLPYILAAPICFSLCAYMALYPAVFSTLVHSFKKYCLPWLWAPSLWVILEWIRSRILTGFPWNLLGYSQGKFSLIAQSADIWGVLGISWIIMFINVAIADTLRKGLSLKAWTVFLLILAFILPYGYHQKKHWEKILKHEKDQRNGHVVALVQGNIEQTRKWDASFRQHTIERYYALSKKAISEMPSVELVIWPETAMPFFFGIDLPETEALKTLVRMLDRPVFFGSPGVAVDLAGRPISFLNKAYLLARDGKVIGEYSKQHLVPFGEYVPLKKLLFFVKRLVPAAGDFAPGKGSGIIKYGKLRMGILICYEAIFPDLVRKRIVEGATALVNISNDAWFGKTSAPYQHLEMARWRAIETRRFVLRSTNTGITAVVDPLGNIVSSLTLFREGYITAFVFPQRKITFYVRHGDAFVGFCMLTVLISLVYGVRRKAREKGGLQYDGN